MHCERAANGGYRCEVGCRPLPGGHGGSGGGHRSGTRVLDPVVNPDQQQATKFSDKVGDLSAAAAGNNNNNLHNSAHFKLKDNLNSLSGTQSTTNDNNNNNNNSNNGGIDHNTSQQGSQSQHGVKQATTKSNHISSRNNGNDGGGGVQPNPDISVRAVHH